MSVVIFSGKKLVNEELKLKTLGIIISSSGLEISKKHLLNV